MLLSVLTKLVAIALSVRVSGQSYNGLAITPPMGWDNWNAFGCDVSEELLLETAGKMVEYGLRDLGYRYVILDDCWQDGRTPDGTLLPNMTKFPNGMAHVANHIHALGLGFEMYSSAGLYTCAKYVASLGMEREDAQTFAEWGVDYLKYDNCYNAGQSGTPLITYNRYYVMSKALNDTGRHIIYSMCNWGEDYPWNWAQTMANSWRMSGDIYTLLIVQMIDVHVAAIPSKSQPGAWNDMDNLEVGNGGMTDDEYKAHFSMWAIMKSPLVIGTDIRQMTASSLSIYSNPAVLALSQDPLGVSAYRIWRHSAALDNYSQGEISLWVGPLSGGDYVVALLNAGNEHLTMNASLSDIFLDKSRSGSRGPAPEIVQSWDIYDLWANRMNNETAMEILHQNQTSSIRVTDTSNSTMRYNATKISYADGLAMNHKALLGSPIGTIPPKGTLTAVVPRHGIGLFRIRSQGMLEKHDEL